MANPWDNDPVVEQPKAAPAPQPWEGDSSDPLQRSMLLPLAKNKQTGEVEAALPRIITGIPDAVKGMYDSAKSIVTAPGDAMSGELPVMGPDGNVTPEAIGRSLEFAAGVTPMAPGLRAGEAILPGAKAAFRDVKVKPPTANQLKEAGNAGYENLRSIDAQYSSQSISDMAANIEATLQKQGVNEKTAPNTIATLRELQSPPDGSFATASDLETIRRTFSKIGEDFNNQTDRNAGKFVRGAIDSFFASPPAGSVLSGAEDAAAQAGRIAADARANWAAGKRSGRLTDTLTSAEDRAAATNSGQNLGNTLRQRAASILDSAKLSSGFTENELAAIRAVARGTTGENLTRHVGKLLGGGGGLGMNVSGALTGMAAAVGTGNPYMAAVGAIPPVAGATSNTIANILTKRSFEAVNKATRQRSPLFEEMQKAAGREAVAPTKEASFLRMLMLGSQGDQ